MKRKPPIKELKKRSAIWFDGETLRLTLSKKELPYCCLSCSVGSPINSWYYDPKADAWFTSFFPIEGVRMNYEFMGFI